MTEIELLKKLISIENDLPKAIFDVTYAGNVEVEEIAEENKTRIEVQIGELERQLIEINDKKYSNKAKNAIIRQLNHYIEQINNAQPGARLTRNQRMISENMLFGLIAKDLYYLISDDIYSIHIPQYLEYTYIEKNSIATADLIEFLQNEVLLFTNIQNINYVVLRNYFNEFKDRIAIRFINN